MQLNLCIHIYIIHVNITNQILMMKDDVGLCTLTAEAAISQIRIATI